MSTAGGVTFDAATGVLSGTPAAGTGGAHPLTFSASNGITRVAKDFLGFKAQELQNQAESQWRLLVDNNLTGRPDMVSATQAAVEGYARSIVRSATELIAAATTAIRSELTARELGRTIHAHPTFSEAWMEAAHAFHGECIHSPPKRK